MSEWQPASKLKDNTEPVVYIRPSTTGRTKWHVGIAYWTLSGKWIPEQESQQSPHGFTHWMPLPEPPEVE